MTRYQYWRGIKIIQLILFGGFLFAIVVYKIIVFWSPFEGYAWTESFAIYVGKNGAIAGLSGLLTNIGAIWLLFRPHTPVGLGSIKFGLIPANKNKIAEQAGEGLAKNFFDTHTFVNHLEEENHFSKHMPQRIKRVIHALIDKSLRKINISKMVSQKIKDMDIAEFETQVRKVVNENLVAIEVLGGFFGFFLGVIFSFII